MRCEICGFDNPAGMRFCGSCGAPLASTSAEERKLVTVLFVDTVNSTHLAGSVDPERLREQMARFFALTREEIERFGGTVEKFIGDAVMAVFGLPTIHEDDAERAVRAAVSIQRRTSGDAPTLPQLRIGINTGEVVANPRAADKGQFLITGEAVNLAARLQQHAGPGQVLIGERTLRAVRHVADVHALAPVSVKGRAEALPAWLVAGIAPPAERALQPTPFIGREEELALLGSHLGRMHRDGRGHVITILGSGGVGKTRLAHEVRVRAEGVRVLRGRALPYGTGVPFWSLAEAIREDFGIVFTDPLEVARRKVLEAADRLEVAEVAAALRVVLGLEPAHHDLTRDALFAGVRTFLQAMAQRTPVLLILEDLHSAEDVTLEFLEYAADWIRQMPLVLLVLSRPELLDRRPGWMGGKRGATTLFLEPLGQGESALLMQAILDGTPAPAPLADLVLERAGGNPLFMEEILRTLVEQGVLIRHDARWTLTVPLAEVAIPDTIHAVIAARLDALPPAEKHVLQAAAVEGKDFYLGAVRANVEGGAVEDALRGLIEKDLILQKQRSTIAGEDEFTFRHILIRDVAYATIAKGQRLPQHARHAEWLRQMAGDRLAEFADVIAHHWLQVVALGRQLGRPDDARARREAITNLLVAGDRARATYANATALDHYARILELEPASGERLRATLGRGDVWMLLGQHERAREDFVELRNLAQTIGDQRWEAVALDQLGLAFRRQDQIPEALDHLGRALATSRLVADPALTAQILNHIGFTHFSDGRLRDAIAAHEEAHTLLAWPGLGSDAWHATIELAESLHGVGENLEFLNKIAESQRYLAQSIIVSQRLGNRSLVAENTYMLAHGHLLLADLRRAAEEIRRAIATLTEIGDVWNLAVALMISARIASHLGEFGQALEQGARGVALGRQIENVRFTVYNLLVLGLVHREMEDYHGAWQVDREAVLLARTVGGAWLHLALAWSSSDAVALGRVDEAAVLIREAPTILAASQKQVEGVAVAVHDGHVLLAQG